MSVFDIQQRLVDDYRSYVKSLITIRDERIRSFVHGEYVDSKYWPEAIVQLSPFFAPGSSIPDLAGNGTLHPGIELLLRTGDERRRHLHWHQHAVAEIATRLFEAQVKMEHDIGETLWPLTKDPLPRRAIEGTLRARIAAAAGNDVDALPSPLRTKLQGEYAKHNPNATATPSLRSLLCASYLTDLEKIARTDTIWPNLGGDWGSKRKFTDAISDLTASRNPMSHGRKVSESVRSKGAAAVTWFEACLGIPEHRHA